MPPRASAERCRPAARRTRQGNHRVLVVLARDAAPVLKAKVVRASVDPVGLAATVVVSVAPARVVDPVALARVGFPAVETLVVPPMAVDPVAKPAAPIEAGIPTLAHFP